MPVKAVGGGIQRAVGKPADMQVLRVVGDIAHLGVGSNPVDALAMFGPEGVRIGGGVGIHRLIAGIVDQRGGNGAFARGKQSVLGHPNPPTRNADPASLATLVSTFKIGRSLERSDGPPQDGGPQPGAPSCRDSASLSAASGPSRSMTARAVAKEKPARASEARCRRLVSSSCSRRK